MNLARALMLVLEDSVFISGDTLGAPRRFAVPASLRTGRHVNVPAFVAVRLTPVSSHSASCLVTAPGK
jgi:hypothetical protein